MKKVLIVFGLYHTLIEFDKMVFTRTPELLVVPKKGCENFINDLREIKRMYKGIDFHIISNLEPKFIETFLDKTKSRDVFNQKLAINFKSSITTNNIYGDLWHKLLNYESKKVFEIEGYDKVILIDCNKVHRLDFLSLKLKKLFMKKSKENKKFKKGVWGYIYPKTFEITLKEIKRLIEKEKGISVR